MFFHNSSSILTRIDLLYHLLSSVMLGVLLIISVHSAVSLLEFMWRIETGRFKPETVCDYTLIYFFIDARTRKQFPISAVIRYPIAILTSRVLDIISPDAYRPHYVLLEGDVETEHPESHRNFIHVGYRYHRIVVSRITGRCYTLYG